MIQADDDEQNFSQVDESGLEKEPEETSDIEIPFDPSKIDIQVKTISISTLQSRLKNNELDLTPDFQRQANVWDVKRKSRLIESVLLRIPLPSFYLSEDENGVYAVVDGLQRLCTLFHFMDYAELNRVTEAQLNPLRLNNLQYLKELNGKSYGELDRKFERRISELEITANIIRASTPPAVKFNVFARLNQGGMPLNAQEIRNAIYPGQWRKTLQFFAKHPAFLEATGKKIKTQRQQDIELVLRFVALWQLKAPFQRSTYQNLDDFLNETVDSKLRHWDREQWLNAKNAFECSLKSAQIIFGNHVFRKSVGGKGRTTPINRGLFEAQLIALSAQNAERVQKLIDRKDSVQLALQKNLEFGTPFANSLLYATGSAEASNIRIKELMKIFEGVINA